jgi:hypothetical protein
MLKRHVRKLLRIVAYLTFAPGAKGYNLTFAAVAVPIVLGMVALASSLEPVRGDLTRTGGFAEADYGWNQPQERFSPPLVSTAYVRPADIVILGDSFTANPGGGQTDPGTYWPNFLAQRTGLSVVVVRMTDMNLDQLLRHPVWIESPPQLFILQTVERYLIRNYVLEVDKRTGPFRPDCPAQAIKLPPLPEFSAIPSTPTEWRRSTAAEFDFGQVAKFVELTLKRELLGMNTTRVVRLALTRGGLFSSRVSDQLLVYDDELLKARFANADAIEAAYCTLVGIQSRVQRNGFTRFLFAPTPDKASAYGEYLVSPELRDLSLLPEFYLKTGLNQVDLLSPIREAIRSGAKDVYMPNDTHWSSTAHRIVAESVHRVLVAKASEH